MVSVVVVTSEIAYPVKEFVVEDVIIFTDPEDAEREAEKLRKVSGSVAGSDAVVFHDVPLLYSHAAQMSFLESNTPHGNCLPDSL